LQFGAASHGLIGWKGAGWWLEGGAASWSIGVLGRQRHRPLHRMQMRFGAPKSMTPEAFSVGPKETLDRFTHQCVNHTEPN